MCNDFRHRTLDVVSFDHILCILHHVVIQYFCAKLYYVPQDAERLAKVRFEISTFLSFISGRYYIFRYVVTIELSHDLTDFGISNHRNVEHSFNKKSIQ